MDIKYENDYILPTYDDDVINTEKYQAQTFFNDKKPLL